MPVRKLGRLAPHDPERHPRLRLGQFLTALPPVPAVVDYASDVPTWPMYLNDSLGCCTCSAAGHMVEAWTAKATGTAVMVTDNDVLKAYEDVSGYRPGEPWTDQGAVMQDVNAHLMKTGIGGHKIAAYAQVDHTNLAEVKAALYLFGEVYVGVNLPNSALQQNEAGQPWTVVADDGGIAGGHAINLARIGPDGMTVITWGATQLLEANWWERYVEECWCVFSTEWLTAAGTSPEGIDLAGLSAAYLELTGRPFPHIRPTPVPPVPTPGPDPVVDPDTALVDALDPWAARHHAGINAAAARAFVAWRHAKNL